MVNHISYKKMAAAQRVRCAAFFFCLIFVALSLICDIDSAYGQSAPYAKYAILMIADGWGQTKIDAANMYTGSVPFYQTDPQWTKHWMTTYPYGCDYNSAQAWGNFSYVMSCVTDSAAAATALYTGIKTQNGRLNVSFNGISRLFTIGEIAKTYGEAVGAITTVPVTDATPGAMVAHNDSRTNYYAIADEGFFGDPNTTGAPSQLYYGGGHGPTFPVADVLIGDGRDSYVSTAAKEKLRAEKGSLGDPGRDTAKHYLVERQAGQGAGTALMQAAGDPYVTKLAGLFDQVYRKADGSGYDPENPTLSESTEAALTVLGKNPDGFVLMIEGGAVDWAGHINNLDYAVGEMIDFSQAVQTVTDWINDTSNDSNWNNTLLIVTGDHETGYLTAGPGLFPDQPIGPVNAQTLSLEKIYSNSGGRRASWDDWHHFGAIDSDETVYWAWNTGGHANVLIPLYTRGLGSGLFENCVVGSDQVRGDYIDNTDVERVMESALSGITTKGFLSIQSGQILSGNFIDLTSIVNAHNADNVVYTVSGGVSCPGQNNESIITKNDTWKYNGSSLGNIGTTWKDTGYDDSVWSMGNGFFGYGNGSEPFPINTPYGASGQMSMYFRNTFTVCDPAAVTSLTFKAAYDDGIAVYINGTQVIAAGVTGNPPLWNGGAVSHAAHNGTSAVYITFNLDAYTNLLVPGTNVIAVGLYNVDTTSSDLLFDGELIISSTAGNSALFTGNEGQAMSVDTSGWTVGTKDIQVSGYDAECLVPLPAANGSFAFENLVNYYCDSDGDTFISAVVSGSCIGQGCAPSGCQTGTGPDCDDGSGAINPGAPESCNNVDDNCNGMTDENLTRPTTCGVGICSGNTGIEMCSAGAWGNNTCDPYAGAVTEGPPGDPSCIDNLDNDCDGATDISDGDCHVDHETNCYNGIDDDVDGMTDCADPDCSGEFNGACITGQSGICSAGTLICQGGTSVCVADNLPQAEICDGLDNNCDGSVDGGCDDDGDGYCDNAMTVSGAPVPVCTLSADGPGDDCNDNDLNIYPGGPSVRISGTLPEYYISIQAAYNSTASSKVLQTQVTTLQEDLLLDMNKTVAFESGYDCGFSNINGKTSVTGNMTISSGVVTISNGTLELN